ncbi:helix-turn-helix domain-containing protein [Mycobacterium marseillense]|uniref:helix-turn-helix transcriptional regulator n=1 Tax=Mycobacterium marseillense TaxID=701042 RepID=UPI0011A1DED4|nr:helix-turn-helix domain-containing protein [Mycobacterium marseillense]MDM3975693.1 helix-turn-helix domain-containing protein [Mycobacterium marseillense]
MDQLRRDAAGIGALADPVRYELYRFVCSQPGPVSRDQAAEEVGIARHQAKFHLDRLTAEGLLECDYARLTGRSGPGAGRTSKLYRRVRRDIAVSLPQRQYELAGRLMAHAIVQSQQDGAPVVEALHHIAHDYGRSIAATALSAARRPLSDARAALRLVARVLQEHGYEPRQGDDGVYLVNCPFHALAQEQTELACGMNHALINGMVDAMTPQCLHARLQPTPGRCCVVVAPDAD